MQSGHVTQRCHNSPRREMGDGVRMTSRIGSARRILWIRSKLRELKLDAERGGSTFGALWGETHLHAMGATRWISQHKKMVSLSLCRNLYLKSNKKVSYQNKEVVTCFRISIFLCSKLSVCGYEHYGHSMYVSHIAISWL